MRVRAQFGKFKLIEGCHVHKQRIPVPRVVRCYPKIGRNNPCPCGSGRKYKKCCLN
jgi:uncharacterized protein YecA (UPF0149 family)